MIDKIFDVIGFVLVMSMVGLFVWIFCAATPNQPSAVNDLIEISR